MARHVHAQNVMRKTALMVAETTTMDSREVSTVSGGAAGHCDRQGRPWFRTVVETRTARRWSAVRPVCTVTALTLALATACTAGARSQHSAQSTLTSFAGQWYVHGAGLSIGSDGSGNMTWNAGPCSQNIEVDEGMCTGHASIKLKSAAGGVSGTLTKVWYTANTGPLPSDFMQPTQPAANESFTLRMVNADMLYTTWYSNPTMNEGNRNWCRSGYIDSQVCGA